MPHWHVRGLWRCTGPLSSPSFPRAPDPLPLRSRRTEEDTFPNLLRLRQLHRGPFPFAAEFGAEPPPPHHLVVPSPVPYSFTKSKNIGFTRPSVARSWAPREELKDGLMKTRRLSENINDSYFQKLTPMPALVDSTGGVRGSPAKQLSCLQSMSGTGRWVLLC